MPDTPPAAPIPATFAAALRYAIGILLPVAVAHGWLGQTEIGDASALLFAAGTVLYGLWKTHDRQARLTNAANGRIQP